MLREAGLRGIEGEVELFITGGWILVSFVAGSPPRTVSQGSGSREARRRPCCMLRLLQIICTRCMCVMSIEKQERNVVSHPTPDVFSHLCLVAFQFLLGGVLVSREWHLRLSSRPSRMLRSRLCFLVRAGFALFSFPSRAFLNSSF